MTTVKCIKKNGPNKAVLSRGFLATLLFLGILQACSSSGNSGTDELEEDITDALNENVIVEPTAALIDSTDIAIPESLPAASSAVLFEYTMDAVDGGTTPALAQLFKPAGPTPDGGYPLVVWARGTTGIANACTPSQSFDDFGNEVAVNSLLEAGYAVLAPDYEGFGTPALHPYFIRNSHANSVLDAIPAAHEIDSSELSAEWAMVGHSQGGHVVLATARAEQDPAFPLQAVVALAPGTDLIPLSNRAFEALDMEIAEQDLDNAVERIFFINVNGGFVLNALPLIVPSLNPTTLFDDDVAGLIDIAVNEEFCGEFFDAVDDALFEHLVGVGTLEDFGGLRRDWFTEPVLTDVLEEQSLNDEAQSVPLLVVQGDDDTQIPDTATTDFVNLQLSLGTDVTYELIPGADHIDVASSEFGISVDWLTERFPAQ